ncbi:MAG: transposase [Gammaproteobacteria bacterium]|nr:transposase [Gammaproteobacteria bacterium]
MLLLKQLDNLSDEKVVMQFKRNPITKPLCGQTEFSLAYPCDSTELVYFRKRIGEKGVNHLFQVSVALHGKAALDETVNIDTTVQEKPLPTPPMPS